jgi:hypothetical protein
LYCSSPDCQTSSGSSCGDSSIRFSCPERTLESGHFFESSGGIDEHTDDWRFVRAHEKTTDLILRESPGVRSSGKV